MGLWRLSVLALAAAIFAQSTYAGARHHIRFAQTETVMVWQDGAPIGSGVEVFISSSNASLTAPMMGSGILDPITAPSSINAQSTILELASNSGFVLIVDHQTIETDVQVAVLEIGEHAELRPSAATGSILFEQTGKTAAHPGSARSQAIKLEVRWTGDIGPDLRVQATGS